MKNPGYKRWLLSGLLYCFFLSAWTQPHQDSLFKQPYLRLTPLPNAASMEVDDEGNLFLLEIQNARLHKFFVNTAYDSAISIGGKSGRQDGFIHPVSVSVRNRQQVYLLDDLARRIVLLSTDFQVVGEIDFFSLNAAPGSFNQTTEVYPQAFDTGAAGETFILNQLDNRVYKLDQAGEVLLQFGGMDYGKGSLANPVGIALSDENDVWVSDTLTQSFHVFDYFGVFRYRKPIEPTFRWKDFSLYGSVLICFDSRHLYMEHLPSGKKWEYHVSEQSPLIDVKLSKDFIYLLFEKEITVYRWN